MSAEEAARLLSEHLRQFPWLNTVGIGVHDGKPAIYVYVKSAGVKLPLASDGWQGFPVFIRKMGTLRPV